ncbi:nucleoside hydrolase [Actinoplanes solisilvae]|uniref:nucleoside hydrolase n=1 Tax=Actinoplanes solisilvae TaxID=2486853 RepID=UPI000FDB8F8B|nr:nucleoside hydrolase [Actinoplanes solisilvae]
MRIYLDCDTGIDDAIAIALLLAHDDVTIEGIGTVNGNTSAVQASVNTRGLLRLAGRDDIPVAVGAGRWRGGADAHGDNGVGGVVLPEGARPDPRTPEEMLIELARGHPGELVVIATGPCGNLAAALRNEPRLPDLVKSVTVMGGAVRVPGNVTGEAEANIADDPQAAKEVFEAAWPLTLVPLDVTMQHRWDERNKAALAASRNPLNEAIAAMLPAYFDSYEPRLRFREVPLHDPLAAAIAIGDVTPSEAPDLGVRVDVATGRTEEDPKARKIRVVLALDEPAGPRIRELLIPQ